MKDEERDNSYSYGIFMSENIKKVLKDELKTDDQRYNFLTKILAATARGLYDCRDMNSTDILLALSVFFKHLDKIKNEKNR